MHLLTRFHRLGSATLVLAVAAYATYSFVAAGRLPSTTGVEAPPVIQVGTRTQTGAEEKPTSSSRGEPADVRDFSYTGRPVPSGYSIK
jgi:hypothetical protein